MAPSRRHGREVTSSGGEVGRLAQRSDTLTGRSSRIDGCSYAKLTETNWMSPFELPQQGVGTVSGFAGRRTFQQ